MSRRQERNPDYRMIPGGRSTRANPIQEELPAVRVGNDLFQQIFGPQLRHQVFPQRQLRNAWLVYEQPTNEPGMFRDRLDFRYPTNLMVPQSNRMLNDRQLRTLWGDARWSVLTSFTSTLSNWIRQSEEQYQMVRLYMVHDSNQLDIVGIYPHSNNPQRQISFTLGWERRMQYSLARALLEFTEQYYDEEGQIDRNIAHLRIFVDLAPQNMGGGARNIVFPDSLLHLKTYLFNPSDKECFFKCIRHLTGDLLVSIKLKLKECYDFQNYKELFQISSRIYNQMSFRLYSITGMLLERQDGPQFNGDDDTKILALILHSSHWYRILDIPKFIKSANGNAFYCLSCDHQQLELDELHQCGAHPWKQCDLCNLRFKNELESTQHSQANIFGHVVKECQYCGRKNFKSETCLDYHTLNCQARMFALQMVREDKRKEYQRNYDVQRRETYTQCFNCHKRYVTEEGHACYLEKRDPKDPQFQQWYAFDYECMLTPHPERKNVDVHTVNYVCVAKLWSEQTWQFESLDAYFQWMRDELIPTGEQIGMIAHNLKGYDGRLTLAKIFENQAQRGALAEDMIWTMAKINTFRWNNIVFRDSLLHIPQPLAAWPKTFNLRGNDVEISKGYFPYLFNTPENQNYVGPIPHVKYFQPNLKSTSDRTKFLQWYEKQKDVVYNFKEELKKYCIADVNILARGLEVYSKAGKELNGDLMDPLEKLTIASYTTNVWFTDHFPADTIVWHNERMAENARAALRGGKTDIRQFYKKYSMEDVFVKKKYASYVDVQSMYPFVMYKREYPVGKATIQYENCTVESLRASFGFACVTIDPPPHYVHHPALVHVRNGRLCATLETWVDTVFTTVEICDALDQGWTIRSIKWIQTYAGRSDNLFKAYIEKLVTEKIHSSKLEVSPEQIAALKEKWFNEFNIVFDEAKIHFNAGRRALAKLMLNSLWGKLSERFKSDFAGNVDAQGFRNFEIKELAGEVDITHKYRLNDDTWFLVGKRNRKIESLNPGQRLSLKQAMTEHHRKTCVEIGSYVTMWGRRMLWQEMVKLGRRVIYHDTDSIVYEYDASKEYNVETGNVLGDWEVEHDGDPIIEFVGLAPKTYALRYLDMKAKVKITPELDYAQFGRYEIWDGYLYPVKEECKVKGFKLHFDARTVINFDGLLELYKQDKVFLQAQQLMFEYNRSKNEITTRMIDKCLVFNYEKGVIGADNMSYPFGVEKYWNTVDRFVEDGTPRKTNEVLLVDENLEPVELL
jgi:hypothetical protein